MRFLKNTQQETPPPHFTTNNPTIENYLEHTKEDLDNYLYKQQHSTIKSNVSKNNLRMIEELRKIEIVIKAANKNLGIVVLNAKDYVNQCLLDLSTSTYTRIESFPLDHIKRTIQNILINFKEELSPHKRLYSFLHPAPKPVPQCSRAFLRYTNPSSKESPQ